MKRLSYSNPVLVSLGLAAIAFLLRILDLFVIRSDELRSYAPDWKYHQLIDGRGAVPWRADHTFGVSNECRKGESDPSGVVWRLAHSFADA